MGFALVVAQKFSFISLAYVCVCLKIFYNLFLFFFEHSRVKVLAKNFGTER